MRIPTLLIACLAALVLLPGCKSRGTTCKQDNKDYVGAQELPPLKAPPGLDPPDTRNALKIPPLDAPEDDAPDDELGLELELESVLPVLRTPRDEPGVRLDGVALSPVPVLLPEPDGLTRV
jgi:hypothetical protein